MLLSPTLFASDRRDSRKTMRFKNYNASRIRDLDRHVKNYNASRIRALDRNAPESEHCLEAIEESFENRRTRLRSTLKIAGHVYGRRKKSDGCDRRKKSDGWELWKSQDAKTSIEL